MRAAPLRMTVCFALLLLTSVAKAGEQEAIELSRNLHRYHFPSNMVAEIITTEPTNKDIIFYIDVGDAALWTGYYLAAEAFRYSETHDPEALEYVKSALKGIQSLVDLPGDGYLARSAFKVNEAHVDTYLEVEGGYGMRRGFFEGEEYYWQMGVTRDQYAGVFFGLSIAYDYTDDPEVKATAADLVTRMTEYLQGHMWSNKNWPEGGNRYTSSYLQMPQMRLSILQIAAHMNPEKFKTAYEVERFFSGWSVGIPLWIQTRDLSSSYFKFNLEEAYIYNLIRLEDPSSPWMGTYKNAYNILRKNLGNHQNPLFNLVDREVNGPNAARDQETRDLLETRLNMGFRNTGMDLRGQYPSCGNEEHACDPVPLRDRAVNGFMWQNDPYDLYWEGDARIEGTGVDYLLPYWMARVYDVY